MVMNIPPYCSVSVFHTSQRPDTYLRGYNLPYSQPTQRSESLDHNRSRSDVKEHPPVIRLRIRLAPPLTDHRVGSVHRLRLGHGG